MVLSQVNFFKFVLICIVDLEKNKSGHENSMKNGFIDFKLNLMKIL